LKSVCGISLPYVAGFYFIKDELIFTFPQNTEFLFGNKHYVLYTFKIVQRLFWTRTALKDYMYCNNITYRLFAMISISVHRVRKQTVIMSKINRIFWITTVSCVYTLWTVVIYNFHFYVMKCQVKIIDHIVKKVFIFGVTSIVFPA